MDDYGKIYEQLLEIYSRAGYTGDELSEKVSRLADMMHAEALHKQRERDKQALKEKTKEYKK